MNKKQKKMLVTYHHSSGVTDRFAFRSDYGNSEIYLLSGSLSGYRI